MTTGVFRFADLDVGMSADGGSGDRGLSCNLWIARMRSNLIADV